MQVFLSRLLSNLLNLLFLLKFNLNDLFNLVFQFIFDFLMLLDRNSNLAAYFYILLDQVTQPLVGILKLQLQRLNLVIQNDYLRLQVTLFFGQNLNCCFGVTLSLQLTTVLLL